MKKSTHGFLATLFLIGMIGIYSTCSPHSKEQKIIDQSIQAHGGDHFKKVKISFDFRDRHYEIFKGPSKFEYSREFADSTGLVKDILNNEGFIRTINGERVAVPEEKAIAYSNSVNAVAYFAFLPHGLNDAAVIKAYLGEREIAGSLYHLIKVTFREGGGGEDFDDEFLYWVNKENFRIDYLAYSYQTDGGGVRFRKAINPRLVEGILIQDYENYKPAEENTPLEEMEILFKKGKLDLLSEIILENVQVTLQK